MGRKKKILFQQLEYDSRKITGLYSLHIDLNCIYPLLHNIDFYGSFSSVWEKNHQYSTGIAGDLGSFVVNQHGVHCKPQIAPMFWVKTQDNLCCVTSP